MARALQSRSEIFQNFSKEIAKRRAGLRRAVLLCFRLQGGCLDPSMDQRGSTDIFLFEGFRFHYGDRELFRLDPDGNGSAVSIGARALDLLALLAERHGRLVSKTEIIDVVWRGSAVEEANLTVQISALRRVLDRDHEENSCIQTVPGRGYRFVAPVTRVEPAAAPVSSAPSANDGAASVVDNGRAESQRARVQIGSQPGGATPRARQRLWRCSMAAVTGALILVAATVVGLSWHRFWSGETRPAPRLSIVVLPFVNLSDDREQQYFADALTEDLTTDLSRIADMLVISRNTAFTYRDRPVNAKQIGRELGVRYLLDGSVRRLGDQVRISAQLIDARTDAHLWAERLDHGSGDLSTVQDEITRGIAQALNAELIAAEVARPAESPDALDYLLRGRAAELNPPTAEGRAKAIDMFERALVLDPSSVEARIRLALSLANRVLSGMSTSGPADVARSDALIGQTLPLSPASPFAHFVKAVVLMAERRCPEAIPELETVIASNPNWASAYAALGSCKMTMGLIGETIPLQKKAIRLSPRDPGIGVWYWRIGVVHLLQSRTDKAIVWFEKARVAAPGYALHHAWFAAALAINGQQERAVAELTEAQKLAPDNRYSSIAHLKAVAASGTWPNQALFEATFLAGLRKAGMPEDEPDLAQPPSSSIPNPASPIAGR
jgi:TolB-like protein/DNA-binding winged helix-turn-helix (wHTH) protein